jgi:uncharacterized membrane protein YbaN (DUF454 family)
MVYLLCGFSSLLLGIIGVVLPLLPTTPFIILAAFFFSRSSVKFHQILLNNRLFGPMIIQWEEHGVIPLKVKCLSSSMMLLMVSYPIFFKPLSWWMITMVVATVFVALAYIWSRPSLPLAKVTES